MSHRGPRVPGRPSCGIPGRAVARPTVFLLFCLPWAGCGGTPESEPEEIVLPTDQPPVWRDLYSREVPAFHVVDSAGGNEYYVYSLPGGRVVWTLHPGAGRRPATPEEARYALDRYEALHRMTKREQDETPSRLNREERAAQQEIDAELVARMERTIRMWEEERRGLEIKQEAARVAGMAAEASRYDALIADYDRRIALHEMKKRLYTSPEWKAGRRTAPDAILLPDVEAGGAQDR